MQSLITKTSILSDHESAVMLIYKILSKICEGDFMAPASRLKPLQGSSLLFTTKLAEIRGTHFINLGATQWLNGKTAFKIHTEFTRFLEKRGVCISVCQYGSSNIIVAFS